VLSGLPEPIPDLDSKPFWDGCQEGRFLVPICRECRASRWPPGPMCPNCQATSTDWLEAVGTGRVYTWVIVTHSVHAATVDQVPYVVALIELPEGIRVVGNIIGCAPDQVRADLPVELFFEELPTGLRLPNFRSEGGDG
jgi:uncharacterized protein